MPTSHESAFILAATRNGAKFATLNRVMGLHFGDVRIDTVHLPGRTEVIKITEALNGRLQAIDALAKAADLTDRPLRFADGVLSQGETLRIKVEPSGWRAPQPRKLYVAAEPGRFAFPRLLRPAEFTEDMTLLLRDIRHAAENGDVAIFHDKRSSHLPEPFWITLYDIAAASKTEGRHFLQASYGKEKADQRGSLHADTLHLAAKAVAEHISDHRVIAYCEKIDYNDATEDAATTILRRTGDLNHEPRVFPYD